LFELLKPALAADFRGCIEKNLYICAGKNHGADITAFHHHSALSPKLLLQPHHPGADGWKNADARGGIGDLRGANKSGYVFAIQQDAILVAAGFEANLRVFGKRFERAAVIQGSLRTQRLQGKGAIHCAGLKVEQAKMTGQMARDRAFPRASWPIDCNYDFPVPDFAVLDLSILVRTIQAGVFSVHPRFFVLDFAGAVNP
jgi:hypothetical protein